MFRQTVLPTVLFFAAACAPGLTGYTDPSKAATIESFTATPASISAGQTATLAASFSNGIGIIDQGIGPVLSSSSIIVSPSSTTTYTLTVLDASAHAVTRTATVTVGSTGGPPVVTITASPTSLTGQTTATFSFSSSKPDATFSCALDSSAAAACASPLSYSGLSAGSHGFTVTATDKAGQSSAPVSFTWTIDLVPPVATITASPTNPTAQTSASFSFSSNKASSTFSCQLDSGTAGGCTSPRGYSGLVTGSHTFTVTATDQAGNTSTPASSAWTIDLTAPIVTITSSPATLTSQSTASFSFISSQAGSTFGCALDSAAAAACTSPQSYSGLAAGSHSFTVTATDPAGNTSSPASFSWTINVTALVATITGSPANPTNQTTANFSFTSSQTGSTFTCALDSAAAAACTSPQTYSALAGGSHTFSVTATAPSGSVSSPATFAWTIDLVAPVVTVTASPPGLTNQTTATFSFSSSQASSSFSCKLDSGAAAACSSPRSYSGLTAGSHTFTVTATDPAGNASSPASSTWTIDLTAPVASLTASPANPTNQTTASFSFTSSQAGSTFSCKLDSGAAAACTSPKSYSGLASGSHTFTVTATDPAGNASGPASFAWTIDLTPPVVTITATPANPTPQTTASFSFTSSEAGSSFNCKLDSGAAATCTSPQSYSSLASGSHTFSLTATDPAGNVSTPATFAWTIAVPAGGLVISSPLQLDKTTVYAGSTLTGTVTYQNTSSSPITILSVAIAGRPPGGTHSGGPYVDLQPYLAGSTLLPGATVTLTASRSFTASDPIGQWETYPTYQDGSGAYHDGPSVYFTVASPSPTPTPTPSLALLGTNIGLVADWDATQMFADVMKQARHWGSVSAPWDEAAPVDAKGWPTGDAAAIFMTDVPGMGGVYKLSFTGNATVALSGTTDASSVVQNKVYSATSNTTTADVTLGPAEHHLWLSFTGQLGGVKNVKLMRPNHQSAELFNQTFLARLKYFSALRMMDILATNDNPQAVWSDRIRPTNAEQQTTPSGATAGAAWEYVVLLANATSKDVWINIPHLALGSSYQLGVTDYVTKVALLFKYGSDGVNPYTGPSGSATANPVPPAGPVYPPLNPGLKLYVEFSNELWNGIFGQAIWLANLATAAIAARDPDLCYDGTTAQWTVIPRLMAKGAMQISDVFRSVFGDAAMMTQVRPLLAAQIGNSGTYDGLNYLDARYAGSSHYLYAIAGAPYIDILNESALLSVDQIFSEMTSYQSTDLSPSISALASIAQVHRVKMLAYEGGQTLYPSMGNYNNKLAAQTDQRMKTQVLNLYNTWKAAGGDLFVYFNLVSVWNNAGFWGLSPDVAYDVDADLGYPTAEAMPKWGAIRRIVTGQ